VAKATSTITALPRASRTLIAWKVQAPALVPLEAQDVLPWVIAAAVAAHVVADAAARVVVADAVVDAIAVHAGNTLFNIKGQTSLKSGFFLARFSPW
jgi:hypothetical protein